MKKLFNQIRSDRIIFYSLYISIFLQLVTIVYSAFSYFHLPPFLPLFNQMPWGDQRIGTTIQLFIPIGIACCIILFNTIIAIRFYNATPLLARMLSITAVLLSFFVFLFIIRTIQLVI